ncbi:MAG: hypothetical protein RL077_2947 [Verrucomicrobiota bacterium]
MSPSRVLNEAGAPLAGAVNPKVRLPSTARGELRRARALQSSACDHPRRGKCERALGSPAARPFWTDDAAAQNIARGPWTSPPQSSSASPTPPSLVVVASDINKKSSHRRAFYWIFEWQRLPHPKSSLNK